MKKIALSILCIFIALMCAAAVFSADLTAHDFEKFSMNVFSNSSFNENSRLNQAVRVGDVDMNDPSISHPSWIDSNNNLTVDYYDCSEDKFSGYQDVINSSSSGKSVEEGDNLYIYESGDNYFKYIAYKVNPGWFGGDKVVAIYGNDLNQLKEMANTVEFK